MGKARRFLPVLVLFFLVHRPAIGHQPLHWDASIDRAKAAAKQSNRLVWCCSAAPWCTACHHLEDDIRNQPGAAAALEANFVPVKINYDFYPNTAKQYGVTRLPTTVILAPNARGEVLAVIPEYMPVGRSCSTLNKVAADAKRRQAGAFAQIQADPPGRHTFRDRPTARDAPTARDWTTAHSLSRSIQEPRPKLPLCLDRLLGRHRIRRRRPPCPPRIVLVQPLPVLRAPPANARPPIRRGHGDGAGMSASGPPNPQKPAENIKRPPDPPFGLDGFCPVQLVENSRWQPGKKTWGVIHRGRTYLFAGPEEQRRFLADPDRYAPVSSGDDVVLLWNRAVRCRATVSMACIRRPCLSVRR